MIEINYDSFLTRLWDSEEKRMIYPGDYFIYSNIVGESIDTLFLGFTNAFPAGFMILSIDQAGHLYSIPFGTRFIPMRCTTLQAKRRQMIYEGDILKVDWGSEKNSDLLKFFNLPFVMEFRYSSWFPFCHSLPFQENIEILGNIYENPELLEENDNG